MKTVFCSLLVLFAFPVLSQNLPVELMVGRAGIFYQHSLSKATSVGGLGFFNTSSIAIPYGLERSTDVMSQSYLTQPINNFLKAGLGFFYATVPGFKPSLQVQGALKFKKGLVLMVPRVDLCQAPSYDLMLLTEYKPYLTRNINWHLRFQTMANFSGARHNRSYQNLRIGVDMELCQVGLALNLDAYGENYSYFQNFGVYIKKDFP